MTIKYLNEELGGIDGHPLELRDMLHLDHGGAGPTCGQKLANDEDVDVIAVGAVAIAGQSLVSSINGEKPMIYSVAAGPADPKNTNGFICSETGVHAPSPFGTFAGKVLKAKSAAVVYPGSCRRHGELGRDHAGREGNGVKVKRVSWTPQTTGRTSTSTRAKGEFTPASGWLQPPERPVPPTDGFRSGDQESSSAMLRAC